MKTHHQELFPALAAYCQALEAEFSLIPEERKEKLLLLRDYISTKLQAGISPKITVICTHNSRRSHYGQLWLAIGADYYHLPKIHTFSGGTEATAFNPRAVKALQYAGLEIRSEGGSKNNPHYQIRWTSSMEPYQAFSKKYDTETNPQTDFAAVMVCTEADGACPIVVGCDLRLALPYDDPKAFDGTEMEAIKYIERCREIAREMFFILQDIKKS